ncbi:MAG TPA: hypothetical protein VK735_30085 [Pseudonocardia sp.]|uniref:hypothetical protein n=1 Tax=Pseudonocardia sp. TaxID=60912 RepID=UPI002BA99FC0|nr:hypothetical protein [Pseudonocardia sp.]HTF51716.1 hypothetical protein [Pseudonocardia sp.]
MRVSETHDTVPAPSPGLNREATHAALRAVRYALRAYPGPVGELIDRELRGYVDAGHAVPPTALPARLIAKLSAAQGREPAAANGRNTAALPPPRYRPGSPLQWDYGAASEAE